LQLVIDIYKLSERLPKEEKYGLKSQITRAVVSTPSNIAEGASRSSEKEFKRFLEVALGSAFELETQLLIIQKLNMINSNLIDPVLSSFHDEQKMINSFIQKLKTNS